MDILAFLEGSALTAGMAMGAASVISIGPNNLMLVREGIVRGRICLVPSLIIISYLILLVSALVMGEQIAQKGETIRPFLSWFGLIALCWFAFVSLRAYTRSSHAFTLESAEQESFSRCARRVLLTVWCNPLTYIELLIVPAAISCSFMMPICRLLFIIGLLAIKALGCYGYSLGGIMIGPYLKRKDSIRMLDLSSGVIMAVLAVVMLVGLLLRP